NVAIYSFPMRYCPIDDPKYFRNRDFVGRHWNKKFIRAIQAIINSTKGKVGRGREFFEKAFGKTFDEFRELLWMPETFIIYRLKYEDTQAKDWHDKFFALDDDERVTAENFIAANKFTDEDIAAVASEKIRAVLKFYTVRRNS
ncbi:MAG: hypothetical protein IKP64_13275, partial [Selenomonadaceae bacterium]|nr:hypothetical protein [Selenomonadaceae bacterium]